MGERTFRGAIWARDHASPSNLAPWPYPAQRASTCVVRALLRRGRGERGRFRVVSTRRPGTLASDRIAIVSLGRSILWAHMSIVMYKIHVGEYGSHLGHAQ